MWSLLHLIPLQPPPLPPPTIFIMACGWLSNTLFLNRAMCGNYTKKRWEVTAEHQHTPRLLYPPHWDTWNLLHPSLMVVVWVVTHPTHVSSVPHWIVGVWRICHVLVMSRHGYHRVMTCTVSAYRNVSYWKNWGKKFRIKSSLSGLWCIRYQKNLCL